MNIELILQGKIVEKDGKKDIEYDNPKYRQQQINQFPVGCVVESIVRNKRRQRSKGQNAYWHKVCFPVISELTGFTPKEAKKVCKKKFIEPEIKSYRYKGKLMETEVPRGTSDLNVGEGWNFTQDLIKLAKMLGGKILTPCEAGYFCGRKDCEICMKRIREAENKIEYPEEEINPDDIPW